MNLQYSKICSVLVHFSWCCSKTILCLSTIIWSTVFVQLGTLVITCAFYMDFNSHYIIMILFFYVVSYIIIFLHAFITLKEEFIKSSVGRVNNLFCKKNVCDAKGWVFTL